MPVRHTLRRPSAAVRRSHEANGHLAPITTFPSQPLRFVVIAAVAALGLTAPASTRAAAPNRVSTPDATIVQVDGPGLLTLRRPGGTTFPVRLTGIDSPNAASAQTPGDCGATEAADALSRMVAGRRVEVEVARAIGADPRVPDARRPVRDLSGRLMVSLVVLGKRRRHSSNLTVSSRLVRGGWARYGLPTNGTDLPVRGALSALAEVAIVEEPWSASKQGAGPDDDGSLTGRGVWTLCGGRLHLPGGAPAPAFAPAPWSVSSSGVLSAIGEHAISPSTTTGTTLGTFIEAFPGGELVSYAFGCALVVPERGITVMGFNFAVFGKRAPTTMDCRVMSAISVTTTGPGVPALAGGGPGAVTGDEIATFQRAFANAKVEPEDPDSSTSDDVLFLGPSSVLDVRADSSSQPVGVVMGQLDRSQRRVVRLNARLLDPFRG